MQSASASSSSEPPESQAVAPVAPVAPVASEIVTRPDPGFARGKWEAPAWAFWVALVVVLVGATLYALSRLGVRIIPRRRDEAPPTSRRSGHDGARR